MLPDCISGAALAGPDIFLPIDDETSFCVSLAKPIGSLYPQRSEPDRQPTDFGRRHVSDSAGRCWIDYQPVPISEVLEPDRQYLFYTFEPIELIYIARWSLRTTDQQGSLRADQQNGLA